MENQQERTETFSQANQVVEDDYLTPIILPLIIGSCLPRCGSKLFLPHVVVIL